MDIQHAAAIKVDDKHTGVRAVTLLAWTIWGLSALFAVVSAVLASVNHQDLIVAGNVPVWFLASVLMFPTVGAVIVSRRPRNPIGWLLLAGSLALFGAFASQYGVYSVATTSPGSLPGGLQMIWLGTWLTSTGILLL